MCVVSMVGDHYKDVFQPHIHPISWPPNTTIPDRYIPTGTGPHTFVEAPVTRKEFDELKAKVEEMLLLLKRAKRYDEENNEPDCEVEDKMKLLRAVAEAVGLQGEFDIIFK